MGRYKCLVAYDGTNFSGYQIQPDKRTVQQEIERVLERIHKQKIKIIGSGRTDARVHAKGQVFHFDSEIKMSTNQFCKAMNSLLPVDIVIKEVKLSSDTFHARYDVCAKEYRYFVQITEQKNPFTRNYVAQYPKKLDILAMNKAVKVLIGEHDFTSFCATNSGALNKIRKLMIAEVFSGEDNCIIFRFIGTGFLYNMVRIIVGTTIEVGTGKRAASDLFAILQAKNRALAGKTAPPQGLYMWKSYYDKDNF